LTVAEIEQHGSCPAKTRSFDHAVCIPIILYPSLSRLPDLHRGHTSTNLRRATLCQWHRMLAFPITRCRLNSIAFRLLFARNLLPSWLHECMLVHKRRTCGIHIRCYANRTRDGCGMLSKVCAERFLALGAEGASSKT
jgi:hypothetical protein